MKRSGLPSSDKPTGRIIMWRLTGDDGDTMFGALEDGTIMQRLPRSGWGTVVGPGDPDESFDLVMGMTRSAEGRGARVTAGPVEFGFDDKALDEVRAGRNWGRNGSMLMVAFDMAHRVAGTRKPRA